MRPMVTVILAAGILAAAAAAEEGNDINGMYGDEVDTSFALTQARLHGQGFNQVRMINGNPYRLGAFDAQGSEVQLLISPQTGNVYETIYEHPMDG